MLYRPLTRTARLAAAVRSAFTTVGDILTLIRKSGADSAYLEGASDHLLSDIGLHRAEAQLDPWKLIR
ncbi:MAG: hypothetical protein ABL866_09500 [Devosia sp.]